MGRLTISNTVLGLKVRAGGILMGMTLGELTKAIQQHIDLEMDSEVAQGMAEHALGFFGFYNRIIDNALEPTDRNLFYMFQDYNLLTTESEETTLWDGREWRIHYWKFKPDLRESVEAYMQRSKKTEEIDCKKPFLKWLKDNKPIYNWDDITQRIYKITAKIKLLIKEGDTIEKGAKSVSYTHLTLPPKRIV